MHVPNRKQNSQPLRTFGNLRKMSAEDAVPRRGRWWLGSLDAAMAIVPRCMQGHVQLFVSDFARRPFRSLIQHKDFIAGGRTRRR
jgi:hypothetical protein